MDRLGAGGHLPPLSWASPISGRVQAPLADGTRLDAEVLFLALDRPQGVKKLLSLELTGAWVNEAREMPRAVADMLQARVGRYPPVRGGGPTWSGSSPTPPPRTPPTGGIGSSRRCAPRASRARARDMGAVRFAELLAAEMQRVFPGFEFELWGDPAGEGRAQTDERTPFDILRAQGLHVRAAPSNDLTLRRETVAAALTRIVDGEPGLILSPTMTVTRKGMNGG